MAHFAQINELNEVTQVIKIPDEEEHRGAEFIANELKLPGKWLQTSYNNKIRVRYASIGMVYDEALDAFYWKKPFPSWQFNSDTKQFEAPVPRPNDVHMRWDEENQMWVKLYPENADQT